MPKHEILLLPEVAERLRMSTGTVRRLLTLRRKGQGSFPLPISKSKSKGRWLASDVDSYIESLSNVCIAAPASARSQSPTKQKKDYKRRQELAKETLRRHGIVVPQKKD